MVYAASPFSEDAQRWYTCPTIINTFMEAYDFQGKTVIHDVSSGEPKVIFTPDVKLTTGLVLTYDDMPELSAPITIDENSLFTIHEITVIDKL